MKEKIKEIQPRHKKKETKKSQRQETKRKKYRNKETKTERQKDNNNRKYAKNKVPVYVINVDADGTGNVFLGGEWRYGHGVSLKDRIS